MRLIVPGLRTLFGACSLLCLFSFAQVNLAQAQEYSLEGLRGCDRADNGYFYCKPTYSNNWQRVSPDFYYRYKAGETEYFRAKAEADARIRAEAEARSRAPQVQANPVVQQQVPVTVSVQNGITAENAAAMNKQIGDLAGQIKVLETVIQEQKQLQSSVSTEKKQTIEATLVSVNTRVTQLKKDYNEKDKKFSEYLTSIKPNDRDLYISARKASEIYPKIPYYIPGTNETGEFWVEPVVSDRGEMGFSFKFVDINASVEKVRGKIEMTLAEMEETKDALFKLHDWSETAHKEKIRKNFEKRVVCFPVAECPPDGERLDGKASTEVRFNIYEDGATAGRIQRNKGRFIEGYNVSIESALLLQAYLNHVITEAKLEFKSGTQDKKSLEQLFK